jgi:hypothetical protein
VRDRQVIVNEDINELRERLSDISALCLDCDRKGVLDLIAEITDKSRKTETVLNKISEFVRHSDFDEAENTAEAYLAELSPAEALPTQEPTKTRLSELKVNGLNIAKGLSRYESDEATYIKILRSYAASVSSLLGLMEVVDEDTLRDYQIRVHGIKGASYDVFAEEFGKKAEALEDAAKAGDIAFIHEHNPPFIEAIAVFVSEITDMLSVLNAENQRPKKDKPSKELLSQLLVACGDYSMSRAEAALQEIEKYQYETDDDLVDWLRKNLDLTNFQEMEEKLSGLELG